MSEMNNTASLEETARSFDLCEVLQFIQQH